MLVPDKDTILELDRLRLQHRCISRSGGVTRCELLDRTSGAVIAFGDATADPAELSALKVALAAAVASGRV